jgi:hypothetical protein
LQRRVFEERQVSVGVTDVVECDEWHNA